MGFILETVKKSERRRALRETLSELVDISFPSQLADCDYAIVRIEAVHSSRAGSRERLHSSERRQEYDGRPVRRGRYNRRGSRPTARFLILLGLVSQRQSTARGAWGSSVKTPRNRDVHRGRTSLEGESSAPGPEAVPHGAHVEHGTVSPTTPASVHAGRPSRSHASVESRIAPRPSRLTIP